MQLHAVIVPPAGAIEGALQITHSIFSPEPEPVEEPPPRRGVLGRLKKPAAAPPPPPEVLWHPTPSDALFVRVCKFGNVTLSDTRTLLQAIESVAGTWPRPRLHVAEIVVGETEPFSVTARLEGELDDLFAIFRNVLDVAKAQDFFLDRRSFRSEVALGTVVVPDGATVPDALPGAVIPMVGPHWHAGHLTLLRSTRIADATTYEEFASVPLSSSAADSSASQGA